MTPEWGSAPWFILVGGVNGAGKTTLAQSSGALVDVASSDLEIINPDTVARVVLKDRPQLSQYEADVTAAKWTEARVETLLQTAHHSFAVETVLSTDKYVRHFSNARRARFQTLFIYVLLDSAATAIDRVRARVARGGHDVPSDKIEKRWPLSRRNAAWFFREATRAAVLLNADSGPIVVAEQMAGDIKFKSNPPASTHEFLKSLLPAWAV